jgi:DnaJ-domain-containing protein 1
MGIMDRLGNVIKSYLNNEDERIFSSGSKERRSSRDPDLDAAFDELNDFLNKDTAQKGPDAWSDNFDKAAGTSGQDAGAKRRNEAFRSIPEELRADFAELGVTFGASEAECKEAYKKLLKIHHPDRHAGHEGNMKKATEKTARINAAYDRIGKWRKETSNKSL